MILINDTDVIKLPIRDKQEQFCNLNGINERIIVDTSMSQIASKSKFFCYARETIALKLIDAVSYLPIGINFYIKEAYRPFKQQSKSFDSVLNHYKQLFTDMTDSQIYDETCKYVAPPEFAPHPTGAAIDITLITNAKSELDLGTEFNKSPQETENATYFNSENISVEAKNNRKTLSNALTKVGFINYEPEWWHWSIGDRYWAYINNYESALFDVVDEEWIKKNITSN